MSLDDEVEVIEIDSPPGVEVIEVDTPDALDGAEIVSVGRRLTPTFGVQRFHQDTPDSRWVVVHDLGRPAVPLALYDLDGRLRSQWLATHPEVNRMVIDFDVPTAGALDYL